MISGEIVQLVPFGMEDAQKEIRYWQARATTGEEKLKDWSVRSVEQEQRIRELEALNDTQARNMTIFQERIRELEKQLNRTSHAEFTAYAYSHTLEERIQKTREILQAPLLDGKDIQRALDALEGK